jgi:hypothetical protein
MAEMLRCYFKIDREIDELNSRYRLAEKRARQDSESRIRVSQMIYRGVTLRIGAAELAMRRPRRGPVQYAAFKNALVAL